MNREDTEMFFSVSLCLYSSDKMQQKINQQQQGKSAIKISE